jgi:hypothetical protein
MITEISHEGQHVFDVDLLRRRLLVPTTVA